MEKREPDLIQISRYWCVEAGHRVEYALYESSYFEPSSRHSKKHMPMSESQKGAAEKPLLVVLHEQGSTPAEALAHPGLLITAKESFDGGCMMVAPFGYKDSWYGAKGDMYKSPDAPAEQAPHSGLISECNVINVVGIMRAQYKVDPSRIYILGLGQMGGAGALHLASKYPFIWAGAFAASPDLLASDAHQTKEEIIKTMKPVPVMLVHGEESTCPVDNARRWVESMNNADLTYKYLELGGIEQVDESKWGELPREAFDFFEQHRRSSPAPPIVRPSVWFEDASIEGQLDLPPRDPLKEKPLLTEKLQRNESFGAPYENTSSSIVEPEPESAPMWV